MSENNFPTSNTNNLNTLQNSQNNPISYIEDIGDEKTNNNDHSHPLTRRAQFTQKKHVHSPQNQDYIYENSYHPDTDIICASKTIKSQYPNNQIPDNDKKWVSKKLNACKNVEKQTTNIQDVENTRAICSLLGRQGFKQFIAIMHRYLIKCGYSEKAMNTIIQALNKASYVCLGARPTTDGYIGCHPIIKFPDEKYAKAFWEAFGNSVEKNRGKNGKSDHFCYWSNDAKQLDLKLVSIHFDDAAHFFSSVVSDKTSFTKGKNGRWSKTDYFRGMATGMRVIHTYVQEPHKIAALLPWQPKPIDLTSSSKSIVKPSHQSHTKQRNADRVTFDMWVKEALNYFTVHMLCLNEQGKYHTLMTPENLNNLYGVKSDYWHAVLRFAVGHDRPIKDFSKIIKNEQFVRIVTLAFIYCIEKKSAKFEKFINAIDMKTGMFLPKKRKYQRHNSLLDTASSRLIANVLSHIVGAYQKGNQVHKAIMGTMKKMEQWSNNPPNLTNTSIKKSDKQTKAITLSSNNNNDNALLKLKLTEKSFSHSYDEDVITVTKLFKIVRSDDKNAVKKAMHYWNTTQHYKAIAPSDDEIKWLKDIGIYQSFEQYQLKHFARCLSGKSGNDYNNYAWLLRSFLQWKKLVTLYHQARIQEKLHKVFYGGEVSIPPVQRALLSRKTKKNNPATSDKKSQWSLSWPKWGKQAKHTKTITNNNNNNDKSLANDKSVYRSSHNKSASVEDMKTMKEILTYLLPAITTNQGTYNMNQEHRKWNFSVTLVNLASIMYHAYKTKTVPPLLTKPLIEVAAYKDTRTISILKLLGYTFNACSTEERSPMGSDSDIESSDEEDIICLTRIGGCPVDQDGHEKGLNAQTNAIRKAMYTIKDLIPPMAPTKVMFLLAFACYVNTNRLDSSKKYMHPINMIDQWTIVGH